MQDISEVDFDSMLAGLEGLERDALLDSITISHLSAQDALQFVTIDQIVGGHNLRKGDNNLTSKKVMRNPEAVQMERETRARLKEKRRKQIERARKKRAAQDAERERKALDPVRLGTAWAIIEQVVTPIGKITLGLYNRFRRVMGDTDLDDVAQTVAQRLAEHLARTDADMPMMAEAALWLRDAPQPYEAADGPEGARVLLGSIHTVAHRTIVDTYRAKTCTIWTRDPVTGEEVRKDVTLESFDLLTTMAASVGRDVDSMIASSKANRNPHYGSKPPTGDLARAFARVALDSWIEAKGLGWIADLMLSDEHTRTDGSFRWTEHAGLIFEGFDLPVGDLSDGLRAYYAKRAVRLAFKELPDTILGLREMSNDPGFIGGIINRVLDVNILGQTGAELTRTIMWGEKPHSLMAALDVLQANVDDLSKPHAQWKRRQDIVLVPAIDDRMADANRGLRVFLEGQEEGTPPVLIYHGPDDSEWRKIIRSEPSQWKCPHGTRTHVVGVVKKPKKSPRVWNGEFCSLEKGNPDACEPMFNAGKDKITVHYDDSTHDASREAFLVASRVTRHAT
jgi:hypothetical protein